MSISYIRKTLTRTSKHALRCCAALVVLITGSVAPVAVPARAYDTPLTQVAKLAMGSGFTCALLYDGVVKCWGNNSAGQLARDPASTPSSDVPLKVTGLGETVADLYAIDAAVCARLDSGSVKCWGASTFVDSDTPQTFDALRGQALLGADFMPYTTDSGVSDTLGTSCWLVQPASGSVRLRCWEVHNGVWGIHDVSFASGLTPVSMAGGWYHGCVLTSLGNTACWGSDSSGQMGNGGEAVSVERTWASNAHLSGDTAIGIAAGVAHTCAVLTNGLIKCWGLNHRGQLGDGTDEQRKLPVQANVSNMRAVAAAGNTTCGLDSSGRVYCWGDNDSGQLGDGTTGYRLSPAVVPGLDDAIALYSDGHDRFCALLADTSVQCWGDGVLRPEPVLIGSTTLEQGEQPINFGDIASDFPDAPEDLTHEFGDAPDGGINAYAGVTGRFPTLQSDADDGPRHVNSWLYHLGDTETPDAPVDTDGMPNLDLSASVADLDVGDDGWLNRSDITRIENCQTLTLRIRVRRGYTPTGYDDAPLYLNAWFDGNRDGDWRDSGPCNGQTGHEWIVQNQRVRNGDLASLNSTVDLDIVTRRVLSNSPNQPGWLRLSLSDRPAITPVGGGTPDGRGLPGSYFGHGETEDYLWDPVTPRERYGVWTVKKSAGTSGPVEIGSTIQYTLDIQRTGGSAAQAPAALADVLPAQTSFVSGVTVQQLAPTVNPASASYQAGYGGPSGRVRWIGTLTDGARLRLRFTVRVDACTAEPVKNSALLVLAGGLVLSDSVRTPLDCIPPPPPSFSLSKARVDAVGAAGFSGGTHLSETVYLLTLGQSNVNGALAAVIQDTLPNGLRVLETRTSRGVISTTADGRTVNWVGPLGPTLAAPQIWIRAGVISANQCQRDLNNTAQYAVRLPDGSIASGGSAAVTFRPACTPPSTDQGTPPVDGTPTPTVTAPAPATPTPTRTATPSITNTPRPTNTSVPRPTNTSVPVETNTPVPRPTNTSVPVSETNTPVPRATNTPVPVATNTPVPLGADDPPGAPTNTPVPRATNTSVPVSETNTPVPRNTNTPVPVVTYTPVPVLTNTPVPVETYTPVPLPPDGARRLFMPILAHE